MHFENLMQLSGIKFNANFDNVKYTESDNVK